MQNPIILPVSGTIKGKPDISLDHAVLHYEGLFRYFAKSRVYTN